MEGTEGTLELEDGEDGCEALSSAHSMATALGTAAVVPCTRSRAGQQAWPALQQAALIGLSGTSAHTHTLKGEDTNIKWVGWPSWVHMITTLMKLPKNN